MPIELRPLLPGSDLQSGARHDARRHRPITPGIAGACSCSAPLRRYFRYVHGLERMAAGTQNLYDWAPTSACRSEGSLEITQAATYSPSYLYQLFPSAAPLAPGEAVPVNPEYRIGQTESYSYNTRMTLGFGSPRGTRLTTTAEYGLTDFKKQSRRVPTSRRPPPARDSPGLCHAMRRSRPATSTASPRLGVGLHHKIAPRHDGRGIHAAAFGDAPRDVAP